MEVFILMVEIHQLEETLSSTPVYNDVAFISSSATFTLSSNSTNTVQSQATMFSRQYTFKFRSTGRNWKGSINNTDTSNINFYDSTLFDQDSTSGSLAVYSRAQGYDAGSQTGTTSFSEGFSGEDYRIRIYSSFNGWNLCWCRFIYFKQHLQL